MTPYEKLHAMGIGDVFIAGYLVLVDDGYPDADAVSFLLTSESLGKDPYDSAIQLVNLRQLMRDERERVKSR